MMQEQILFSCPCKANILGEQLEHNGGVILAIDLGINFNVALKESKESYMQFIFPNRTFSIAIKEMKYHNMAEYDWKLEDLKDTEIAVWWIINELKERKIIIERGFKAIYNFDIDSCEKNNTLIPFQILTLRAISKVNGYDIPLRDVEIINESIQRKMARDFRGDCENIILNRLDEGKIHILHCNSLKYESEYMDFQRYSFILSFNRNWSLDEVENLRRNQCQQALERLQKVVNISCLCNISLNEFEKFKGIIIDEEVLEVATYVVYENQRVKEAIKMLQQRNLKALGEAMKDSHRALRSQYKMVDEKQQWIFQRAASMEGCLGSKSTRTTFGVGNLTLIENSAIDKFKDALAKAYKDRFNEEIEFYLMSTCFNIPSQC